MPYGPGGAPMRPHHMQGPPPAAAAAAAGGYGVPRGVPGPADRNVRPRHSGGGMPVGAAGPAAGQAGFKPGGAYWGLSGASCLGTAAVGEAVQQHMRQTAARRVLAACNVRASKQFVCVSACCCRCQAGRLWLRRPSGRRLCRPTSRLRGATPWYDAAHWPRRHAPTGGLPPTAAHAAGRQGPTTPAGWLPPAAAVVAAAAWANGFCLSVIESCCCFVGFECLLALGDWGRSFVSVLALCTECLLPASECWGSAV